MQTTVILWDALTHSLIQCRLQLYIMGCFDSQFDPMQTSYIMGCFDSQFDPMQTTVILWDVLTHSLI